MLSLSLNFPSRRPALTPVSTRSIRGGRRGRLKIIRLLRRYFSGIEKLNNIRQGSRFSRVFRYLFEKRKIKTILGGNLAVLVLTASIFSPQVSALSTISETEVTTLSPGVVELTTKAGFRFPLEEVKITQGYHLFHQALDFDGLTGDPVYPITEGRVEAVIYDRFALGNHIILNHGSGLKSVYAHLSKIEVGVGDKVDTDKVIGRIGATGMAFGDHLHFEVLDNDRHINPLTILPIK